MKTASPPDNLIARASEAMADQQLQKALSRARPGFIKKRQSAIDQLNNFEALRTKAQEVRQRSLQNIDIYLAMFEQRVTSAGGHIHWAATTADLQRIVIDIGRQAQAKTVTKGKSMVAEEADLNKALEQANIQPKETDLGEYILQLAKEPPSHIVAPALHKTRQQVAELFFKHHPLAARELHSVQQLVDEARHIIRQHFIDADMGITGANLLIADTGTSVLCTNEGNGDLSASLPNTHIVTTSIDKVVATWDDASAILRVLARSATGQATTTYTSFYGPKQKGDHDGPEHFHIILLDNGRSTVVASDFEEMLHCIKCGACMNHCPVYQTIGGHSYDAVYPGPMGSVLTPLLRGRPEDSQLAHASTFCGRCEEVCPVKIPLPDLLRKARNKDIQQHGKGLSGGLIAVYLWLARQPRLYRLTTTTLTWLTSRLLSKNGKLRRLPGLARWQTHGQITAPQGNSFQQQWHKAQRDTTVPTSPNIKPEHHDQ